PFSGNEFPSPTFFYEFNYLTNNYTQVGAPGGGTSANYPSFVGNMLCLPDGTILYTTQGSTQFFVYTPTGTTLAAGKPTITQITPLGSSYKISGTLFNGIYEGASYGDDWQMSTNYPIIRLTNGSNVYYARTFNWNSTGVRRGSLRDSADFTLPAGLPNATYSLVVVANGISSEPISFTPATIGINGPSCVTTGQIYTFTVSPEFANSTTTSWWTNTPSTITVDPNNDKQITLYVAPYTNTPFNLTVGVNFSTSPWYKSYTTTITVGGCGARLAATASPQPFDENTTVTAEGRQIVSVKVFDSRGMEVYNADNIMKDSFTLGQELSAGIYTVQVISPEGVSTTKM
ncbi:MAG TPA: T9SS type A sorting domain-containing protein, partial [Bacteroidia bacterium]|nr:T9SS type A sorting domain-containing protein [Bacteroidia bacterium]